MPLFPSNDSGPINSMPQVMNLDGSELVPILNKGTGELYARVSSIWAGASATVDDWPGIVGDGVTDDTVALQAALDGVASTGGGYIKLGPKRYLIDSANLLIPAGVFLIGPWENLGEQAALNYYSLKYALVLNPAYTVMLNGRSSGIRGIFMQRKGMTAPTSLRTGLDGVAAFSGTAITFLNTTNNLASDSYVGHMFIIGFNKAIYCYNNERPRIEYISGDCTNGIDMSFVTDMQHLTFCHFWPFFTTHTGWGFTTYTVSNAIDNGVGLIRLTTSANTLATGDVVVVGSVGGVPNATGRWTVTVINTTTIDLQGSTFAGPYTTGGTVQVNANRRSGVAYTLQNTDDWGQILECFCYGWDTGYDIFNSDHVLISNCGCDNWGGQLDPSRTGVNIRGTSKSTLILGHRFASQGNAITVNTTGSTTANLYSTRIINCNFWGTNTNEINLVQGRAIISGNLFSSTVTGVVGVRAATTFGLVNINGNEFDGTPTPFNIAAQVLASATVFGNSLNAIDLTVGSRKVYINTQPIDVTDAYLADTRGARFQWRKGRGSPSAPTTVLNADRAFAIEGYCHSGTAFQQCGAINLRAGIGANQALGTISNTSMPGSFVVQLTPDGSVTSADVLTLDSTTLTAPAFIPTNATIPVNGLYLQAASTPGISAGSLLVAKYTAAASAVNYLRFNAAATGTNPSVISQGGDANAGLGFFSQGAGNIVLASNNGSSVQVNIIGGALTAANHINLYGGNTGVAPIIEGGGSDANVDLVLKTKGTGQLQLGLAGQMAANGTVATALTAVGPTGANVTVQEWLQVKNSAGVVRYIPCF